MAREINTQFFCSSLALPWGHQQRRLALSLLLSFPALARLWPSWGLLYFVDKQAIHRNEVFAGPISVNSLLLSVGNQIAFGKKKAINTLCFLLLLSKNRMAINTLASQNRIEWPAHSKGWMGLSPSASHYIFKNFIMAAGQRDDSCLFMAAFVLSVYVYLRIRGQPVYLYEGKERRRL